MHRVGSALAAFSIADTDAKRQKDAAAKPRGAAVIRSAFPVAQSAAKMIRRLLDRDEVQVGIAGLVGLAVLLGGAWLLGPNEPARAEPPAEDVKTLQELLPARDHWYRVAFDE